MVFDLYPGWACNKFIFIPSSSSQPTPSLSNRHSYPSVGGRGVRCDDKRHIYGDGRGGIEFRCISRSSLSSLSWQFHSRRTRQCACSSGFIQVADRGFEAALSFRAGLQFSVHRAIVCGWKAALSSKPQSISGDVMDVMESLEIWWELNTPIVFLIVGTAAPHDVVK
ncbi:hypothetical protein PVAP13_2KG221208 [Panicum virgatum]|uniref:Uncharacterized protein n=1 Tax=Panicum virgatum TaxID=38727 RepID=A0A8T0W3D8_PANVG|nr:hypothetical protein PVAP13_2KG221208 [Panicum virgatum]